MVDILTITIGYHWILCENHVDMVNMGNMVDI